MYICVMYYLRIELERIPSVSNFAKSHTLNFNKIYSHPIYTYDDQISVLDANALTPSRRDVRSRFITVLYRFHFFLGGRAKYIRADILSAYSLNKEIYLLKMFNI